MYYKITFGTSMVWYPVPIFNPPVLQYFISPVLFISLILKVHNTNEQIILIFNEQHKKYILFYFLTL